MQLGAVPAFQSLRVPQRTFAKPNSLRLVVGKPTQLLFHNKSTTCCWMKIVHLWQRVYHVARMLRHPHRHLGTIVAIAVLLAVALLLPSLMTDSKTKLDKSYRHIVMPAGLERIGAEWVDAHATDPAIDSYWVYSYRIKSAASAETMAYEIASTLRTNGFITSGRLTESSSGRIFDAADDRVPIFVHVLVGYELSQPSYACFTGYTQELSDDGHNVYVCVSPSDTN